MINRKRQLDLATVPELKTTLLMPPGDAGGPVFNAPWEAQAFAVTLSLHERGVFTWKEWATALSQAISDAHASGDPDSGSTYYHHWLTALERLLIARNLMTESVIAQRKRLWKEAARRTPHGKPIELTQQQTRC